MIDNEGEGSEHVVPRIVKKDVQPGGVLIPKEGIRIKSARYLTLVGSWLWPNRSCRIEEEV
jgi:hypothetical protein